ncbi:hypothetical protein Hypma_008958 [Hypsizygus marmoreus]|uniref:BTB domain-containing protein n=1 Tax=Hypsizygus marmoreus TaxID=39966 RepID=A0A369JMN0_HYPMA|nr:hypothetical protein Hypma_008958 [Hypsizygus marmoreus]
MPRLGGSSAQQYTRTTISNTEAELKQEETKPDSRLVDRAPTPTSFEVRTSDQVDFYVHKFLLSLVSPVLATTFSLPQIIQSDGDSDEVVGDHHVVFMGEDRTSLFALLTWCDSRCRPTGSDLGDIQMVSLQLSTLITALNRTLVFKTQSDITMIPATFLNECIALAKDKARGSPTSPITSSMEDSSPSLPSSLPEKEATMYYAGLPSSPRLLARTSKNPWEEPKGPEAYRKLKQLGVVFDHKINTVWEDKVAPEIFARLSEMEVEWTSIDVVRIGQVGESSAPVIVWIGVKPISLSGEDANNAAFGCLSILQQFDIHDVDVEIRESSVI